MGDGSADPRPTAIIEVEGEVVGWVDHDGYGRQDGRDWLLPGQCNVGYHVFAPHRGRGIASRAVRLLLELLRADGDLREATFLVDAENEPSLRVARAVGATERERFANAAGRPQVLLAVAIEGETATS